MHLRYRCIDFVSVTAQRNALLPQVHFLAVPQFSSWRGDGNTTTATYRNAAAVDYERSLRHRSKTATQKQHRHSEASES